MHEDSNDKSVEIRTLLLCDLVDSTAIIQQVGDVRAADLLAEHDQLARSLLETHRGIEIDKTDGFLLLFRRPIDAVCYALGYHRDLALLSQRTDCPMTARVGIHLGEVSLRKNNAEDVERGAKPVELEGLAKHIAARIMGCAQGGRTLLSQEAYEVARRGAVGHEAEELQAELSWVKHGSYLLKGSDEPRVLCEVGTPSVLSGGLELAPEAKAQRIESPDRRQGKSAGFGAAIALALALVALAIVFALQSNDGSDSSAPSAGASPAGAFTTAPGTGQGEQVKAQGQDAQSSPVQLHVVVQPVGARVSVAGALVGTSPITVPLEADTSEVAVTAEAPGFSSGATTCVVVAADRARGSALCTLSLEAALKPTRRPSSTPQAGAPKTERAGEQPARRPQIDLID
ncbi:MAG: hypothetical protein CL928_14400 [Deltaproteobacteria bacterium]|nr:hypothetical protein [Deltaproteobacteria bacterium]